MRLGITVVYLVTDGNEPLLDLHLRQIERCTRAPFTIYASATRLRPDLLERLQTNPNVKICDLPETDLRGAAEHNFYLDRLMRFAVEHGATHVATLHVDSFPVRDGWEAELRDLVSEQTPLAAVSRLEVNDRKPSNAMMFCSSEFLRQHQPSMLATEAERGSPEFAAHLERLACNDSGGVGYSFLLERLGLDWHRLLRTNRAEDHFSFGSIYGDMIFHLSLAARNHKVTYADVFDVEDGLFKRRLYRAGKGLLQRFPVSVQDFAIRTYFPAQRANEAANEKVKQQLFRDPDAYLNYLRTGQR